MGKLVKFETRARPASVRATAHGSAQILLFTGVRYERGVMPVPTTRLDPSRPKRKRG